MKFAIDSFSFYKHFGKHWFVPQKPVDIKWYCEKCLALKANGLHIDPYHIDMENHFKWVMDFADKNNLYVELGASGTSYDDLLPYIEAAGKYDIKVLRTFIGGSCLDSRPEIDNRINQAIKSLPKVLEAAEKADVIIAVENHGDIFIEDMQKLMEIESTHLGVCYDSGNFAFTAEDPLKAIELFADRIVCTHLKDVCSADFYPSSKPFETLTKPVHFCSLGEGVLPIHKMLEFLMGIKMQNLTLEICTPVIPELDEKEQLDSEEAAVCKSIKYLKGFFKKKCGASIGGDSAKIEKEDIAN